LVDGSSFVILEAAGCAPHKDATRERFRVRTWIIDEGMLYNSYRDDTGTDPAQGLPCKPSPWHYSQFVCDLSAYLQKETTAEVPVGLNLFSDSVLTNAQGRMRFKKAQPVDQAELTRRLENAVRLSLQLNKDLADPAAYLEPVSRELKELWLDAFAFPPNEPSGKFESAVRGAIRACDDNRRAHERHERQQTMTALQRAEEQARDAMEQVRVLTEHIRELEIEARRADNRHQTEIASLRAQLQRAGTNSGSSAGGKGGGKDVGHATEWACTVCTFLNTADKPKCAMCTAGRESGKAGEGKHN